MPDRKIVLEDGQEYYGYSFGDVSDRVLEAVFNTSMTGYQEILSDPSYTDQAVVMTYPLIGNYGMAQDDYETDRPSVGAMIVREYCGEPSNFRSEESLGDVMKRWGICGIGGVDTRKLTRSIRDFGTRKALLTSADTPIEEALGILGSTDLPRDAVSRVSCKDTVASGSEDSRFHVAAIDCGMKKGILRCLASRGCRVTRVPWDTSAESIMALSPDGVFISNGPGDPADAQETIAAVRQLIGKVPVFGICLGHQIIALAMGARTYKLKYGHRGGNHPVRELSTGRICVTSQNHSYAVDADSLDGTPLRVTHLNILDGTVEGLECPEKMLMSVQYHPESSPGPRDSEDLFDSFIRMMEDSAHA
ncbi:MAG: glutamine-hydrolyzing carbamoyl-phosphate synthase small subunit [Eubacteriaceae bacterium]|nr:glutamine-hydrolyzing carbamoyl-phosphate synthase small subunit [Eubacteriaceae bacterium]